MSQEPKRGAVLFLSREVNGIEFDSGFYVVEKLTETKAYLSMVGEDEDGLLCATDRRCTVPREDLPAFRDSKVEARIDVRVRWDNERHKMIRIEE